MAQEFSTSSSNRDGIAMIEVMGRIDHDTAGAFQEQVLSVVEAAETKDGYVVLDFSSVNYISSVGLRALMLAAKASKTRGGVVAVAAYTTEVGEIFQIARFGFVVKLFDDLDDAVQAIASLAGDD